MVIKLNMAISNRSKKKSRFGANNSVATDFGKYCQFWVVYIKSRVYTPFSKFEAGKDVVVGTLYKKEVNMLDQCLI